METVAPIVLFRGALLTPPKISQESKTTCRGRTTLLLRRLWKVRMPDNAVYHEVLMDRSHAAMVMRRLRRICAALGSTTVTTLLLSCSSPFTLDRRVRFVSCSATIARPLEHMKSVFGLDVSSYAVMYDPILNYIQDCSSSHRRWRSVREKEFHHLGTPAHHAGL